MRSSEKVFCLRRYSNDSSASLWTTMSESSCLSYTFPLNLCTEGLMGTHILRIVCCSITIVSNSRVIAGRNTLGLFTTLTMLRLIDGTASLSKLSIAPSSQTPRKIVPPDRFEKAQIVSKTSLPGWLPHRLNSLIEVSPNASMLSNCSCNILPTLPLVLRHSIAYGVAIHDAIVAMWESGSLTPTSDRALLRRQLYRSCRPFFA